MNIGDEVKVCDGSWGLELTKEGLIDTHPFYRDKTEKIREIVSMNLELPGADGHRNDTILISKSLPTRFKFVQIKFLNKVICPMCGK